MDIADTQLLGEKTESYKDRIDLCIDHHPSNSRYARRLLLDPRACATVQRVYDVIGALGVAPDKRIATCIYTVFRPTRAAFVIRTPRPGRICLRRR